MSLRTALPPLLSIFAVVVCAHAGAIETRAATSQERLSLAAYQRALHPDAAPEQPVLAVFDIARQPRGRGWRVAAHVDAAPTRSSPALCRMIRSRYDYRADAPKDQRWSARTPDQQFVWLSRGAACDAASAPTPRARLLLAGNTQCATSRSLPFHPIALGTATPGLLSITYESDRASTALVTVRKSGAEFSAWNVSCPTH